jgi:hypothetical protein
MIQKCIFQHPASLALIALYPNFSGWGFFLLDVNAGIITDLAL